MKLTPGEDPSDNCDIYEATPLLHITSHCSSRMMIMAFGNLSTLKQEQISFFNAKDKRTICNNNNKLDRQKVECLSFAKPSRRLICKKSRFHQRLHKRKAFSGKLNLANGK
jgi:hypothetical protein